MFTDEAPAPQNRTYVIASGGLDSAVVLHLAAKNSHAVTVLTFDYDQRHIKELEYQRRMNEHLREVGGYDIFELQVPMKELTLLGAGMHAVPTDAPHPSLIPPTWLPGRNLILLTYAAAYGYPFSSVLVAGIHAEDTPGYPDCRPNALRHLEVAIEEGLGSPFALWLPLLNKTKAEIVKLGQELGVPFNLTWSCYEGGERACGKCDACIRRLAAFKANGLKDPLDYEY